MATVINVILGGLFMGSIYALISMGLNLQYGVARILNVSHGEFIMITAMITWALVFHSGVHPLLALVICCPFLLIVGFLLHITIFRLLRKLSPSIGVFEGNAMMLSFGLMFIVQNIGLKIWGSQQKNYDFMKSSVDIMGVETPSNRLFILLLSAVIIVLFFIFLTHTRMGKSIRAASQDAAAAGMMGIKISKVMAICFAISILLAGISGTFISMTMPVNSNMGMSYTVIALIVVVLGGMGSIPGSVLGGLILGFVGTLVSYIDPSLSMVAYYVIILALLLVRPKGLLGR